MVENTSLLLTETQLKNGKAGFSGSFLSVNYILSHVEKNPEIFSRQTAAALLSLLKSKRFEKKKQAYFLYRETAGVLIHISKCVTHPLAGYCVNKLQQLLLNSTGKKHRAVSENLGALPIKIKGPALAKFKEQDILDMDFIELTRSMGYNDLKPLEWHGRTLRFPLDDYKIGCIKFIRSQSDIEQLYSEAHWLNLLNRNPLPDEPDFYPPEPVTINDRFVFRLKNIPEPVKKGGQIHLPAAAIAFFADKTYFHYPNDLSTVQPASLKLLGLFEKNARLLGCFTARGMVHTAIIPLFHNRVQQSRRQDGGRYLWELGGRLDRWLESSLYPNFAASGIRDLEHITSVSSSRDVRHYIGEHILGFILVMGSCFRKKSPELVGTDPAGLPVDTRHLFDRQEFARLIEVTVKAYYKSITGKALKQMDHFFSIDLIDELVEAMGIDHHMEEILRAQDQENMDDGAFKSFLISRGFTRTDAANSVRGKTDIVLSTGPHLGGFNQPINVPALVDFLFCISSLCVSDRYLMENGLKAYAN